MIEKEYYRLEELKERFHLTESDVRYMIERKLVKACFPIRKTKFVVDGWQEDNRIGYAHINYQGLIALPDAEVDTLLANGKITPLNYLLSRDGTIELVETDYPLGIAKPKTFEEAWKPKFASSRNAEFLEARLSPFVSKTVWHSYENARKEVNYSREFFPQNEECESRLAVSKKLDLPLSFNKLQFLDICLRHKDLVTNNLIAEEAQHKDIEPTYQNNNIIKLENEFEDLVASIILQTPQKLTAKKIHRILCDESAREIDQRLYDKNNILLGEEQGVISWRDKYRNNKERSYLQSSLDNVISTVKSKIGKG